jgi:outer membrane protein assembly factor BamD
MVFGFSDVKMTQLSTLTVRLLIVGAAAVLTACSSKPTADRTDTWSPNKIYAEAKDELSSGAFDKAIPLFEKLEGRAAGTPLAQQAQLERAYAQYKSNEPAQALATLDRFMKLHPASPAMDYAFYLKGLINFNDNLGIFGFISKQDLSERDQAASKESYEAFKELVTRFPQSRYAPDANTRLIYIVNTMASYEVHVARYYYKRGAYVAAVSRAQAAVTDYQNVAAAEEALYIMMQSYDALQLTQLRDDTKRVLEKNFPKSEFLSQGFRSTSGPWWKIW